MFVASVYSEIVAVEGDWISISFACNLYTHKSSIISLKIQKCTSTSIINSSHARTLYSVYYGDPEEQVFISYEYTCSLKDTHKIPSLEGYTLTSTLTSHTTLLFLVCSTDSEVYSYNVLTVLST